MTMVTIATAGKRNKKKKKEQIQICPVEVQVPESELASEKKNHLLNTASFERAFHVLGKELVAKECTGVGFHYRPFSSWVCLNDQDDGSIK